MIRYRRFGKSSYCLSERREEEKVLFLVSSLSEGSKFRRRHHAFERKSRNPLPAKEVRRGGWMGEDGDGMDGAEWMGER